MENIAGELTLLPTSNEKTQGLLLLMTNTYNFATNANIELY